MSKVLPNLNVRHVIPQGSAVEQLAAYERAMEAKREELRVAAEAEIAEARAVERAILADEVTNWESAVAHATTRLNAAKAALMAFDGITMRAVTDRVPGGAGRSMIDAAKNGVKPQRRIVPPSNEHRNKSMKRIEEKLNNMDLTGLQTTVIYRGTDTYAHLCNCYREAAIIWVTDMLAKKTESAT